jgi:hypothetical protein
LVQLCDRTFKSERTNHDQKESVSVNNHSHETMGNKTPGNDTTVTAGITTGMQTQARAAYEAPTLENLGVWAGMVGNPVGISMQP